MFTGLIETTGTVLALKTTKTGVRRLVIAAPELAGRWKIGDSIAVNGVCLTAVDMEDVYEAHPGRFAADLAEETIARTTLTSLAPGSLVNLELPTPAGSPMGGHVVQGHVDGVGRIMRMHPLHHEDLDRTDWRMSIELPDTLLPSVIQQGSITVDGISLTIAKLEVNCIEIAVIPHTYKSTNLRSLLSGALVNIETDALSKYAAKRIAHEAAKPTPVAEPAQTPNATHHHAGLDAMAASLQSSHEAASHAEAEKPAAKSDWLTSDYLISNGY